MNIPDAVVVDEVDIIAVTGMIEDSALSTGTMVGVGVSCVTAGEVVTMTVVAVSLVDTTEVVSVTVLVIASYIVRELTTSSNPAS